MFTKKVLKGRLWHIEILKLPEIPMIFWTRRINYRNMFSWNHSLFNWYVFLWNLCVGCKTRVIILSYIRKMITQKIVFLPKQNQIMEQMYNKSLIFLYYFSFWYIHRLLQKFWRSSKNRCGWISILSIKCLKIQQNINKM